MGRTADRIVRHQDLVVYRKAMAAAMELFNLSRSFPAAERYSLTDQMRRSSRSVCANLAEAWRKRRYEKAFINKLSEAEGEAAETQVWIEFAVKCGYLARTDGIPLYQTYDEVIRILFDMSLHPEKWIIQPTTKSISESPEPYDAPF